MLGAAAAGPDVTGFKDANEIAAKFGKVREKVYTPGPEQSKTYDALFDDYMTLHRYFGKGENDVMKRLNRMRKH